MPLLASPAKVQESLDLFLVHAAYASVLHPGRRQDPVTFSGGLGWWDGGHSEEVRPSDKRDAPVFVRFLALLTLCSISNSPTICLEENLKKQLDAKFNGLGIWIVTHSLYESSDFGFCMCNFPIVMANNVIFIVK